MPSHYQFITTPFLQTWQSREHNDVALAALAALATAHAASYQLDALNRQHLDALAAHKDQIHSLNQKIDALEGPGKRRRTTQDVFVDTLKSKS